jgi:hypothetical protein
MAAMRLSQGFTDATNKQIKPTTLTIKPRFAREVGWKIRKNTESPANEAKLMLHSITAISRISNRLIDNTTRMAITPFIKEACEIICQNA